MAEHYDVHANQITLSREQLQEGAAEVFGGGSKTEGTPSVDVKDFPPRSGG